MSNRLVFDTEPLAAYVAGEPGKEVVKEYLDDVSYGDAVGYISTVTLTEIHYITHQLETTQDPDDFVTDLRAYGLNQVKASSCWREASRFKRQHQVALGDAFSLATASEVDATLIAGADDDFDTIHDVEVERFREDPA